MDAWNDASIVLKLLAFFLSLTATGVLLADVWLWWEGQPYPVQVLTGVGTTGTLGTLLFASLRWLGGIYDRITKLQVDVNGPNFHRGWESRGGQAVYVLQPFDWTVTNRHASKNMSISFTLEIPEIAFYYEETKRVDIPAEQSRVIDCGHFEPTQLPHGSDKEKEIAGHPVRVTLVDHISRKKHHYRC